MPKKTKKEKLIAEYRRKLRHLSETSISSVTKPHPDRDSHTDTIPSFTYHQGAEKSPVIETQTALNTEEFRFIKKDLRGTLILVLLLLITEVGIWKMFG